MWYDEGTYSQVAQNTALYGKSAFQIAPDSFVSAWSVNGGFPFLAPITASYALFGVGVMQGRVVMALFTILFSLAAYWLIRRLHGPLYALYALLLLATFPVLYGTGKNILGEVPGLLYLTLFLLTLFRIELDAFRSPPWLFAGAGVLLGLTVVTKPLFLVLLGALGVVGLLYRRTIPWRLRWFVPAFVGFIVPVGIHAVIHLMGADPATLASYYANPYAKSSLITTILHNAIGFFTAASPLYCLIVSGLWASSLYLRRHSSVTLTERVAFFFSLLVLLFYLRTEGWYRYFFTANVLALLFIPSSTAYLLSRLRARVRSLVPFLRHGLLVGVVVLAALQTYQLLFTSWVAVHNGRTTTAELEQTFATIGPTRTVFFLNTPEIVVFAPTNPYYQYMTPAPRLVLGKEMLPVLERQEPDVVVVKQNAEMTFASYLAPYSRTDAPGDYAIYQRP